MAIYIYTDSGNLGPYEESYVKEGLRSGRFTPDTLACRVGDTQWQPLRVLLPSEIDISTSGNSPFSTPSASPSTAAPASNPLFTDNPAWTQNPITPPQQPGAPAGHSGYTGSPPNYGSGPAIAGDSGLGSIGQIMGIVSMCLMVVGLVPCFGWVNWITLSVGTIGGILGFIGVVSDQHPESRNKATIGLVLSLIAIGIGFVRLIMGGGVC